MKADKKNDALILTGYHFTGDSLRNGDRIPEIGEWLRFKGKIIPCESGLHMSKDPLDALAYAPGGIIHKVELRGGLQGHGNPIDKWVGRERKILASANVEKELFQFARWSALNVVHLWDAPEVVKLFLESGDENLRHAARAAARAVAWAAAWAAAMDAARAVAREKLLDLVTKALNVKQ